jgi:hypothetical protein
MAPPATVPPAKPIGDVVITPRPLSDYRNMFLLDDLDLLAGPILDCPGGASPFGAQVRARGGTVTSVDPVYDQPPQALADRTRADLDRIAPWVDANPANFDWSYLGSPQAVQRAFEVSADLFAADYAPDGSGTSPPSCRDCRSGTGASGSRSAASCCSSTPTASISTGTWPACSNCSG